MVSLFNPLSRFKIQSDFFDGMGRILAHDMDNMHMCDVFFREGKLGKVTGQCRAMFCSYSKCHEKSEWIN